MDFNEFKRYQNLANGPLGETPNVTGSVPKLDLGLFDKNQQQVMQQRAAVTSAELQAENQKEYAKSITGAQAFDAAVNTEWVAASWLKSAMTNDSVRGVVDPDFTLTREKIDHATHDMSQGQKEAFLRWAPSAQSDVELMRLRSRVFEYDKYNQDLEMSKYGTTARVVAGLSDPVQLAIGAATGGASLASSGVGRAVSTIGVGTATNMLAESQLSILNPFRTTEDMHATALGSVAFIGGIYGAGQLARFMSEKAAKVVTKADAPYLNEYFPEVKPQDTVSVLSHSAGSSSEMPLKVISVGDTTVHAKNLKGDVVVVSKSEIRSMSDEASAFTKDLEASGQAWKPFYTISYGEEMRLSAPQAPKALGYDQPPKLGYEAPWEPKYGISYGEANRLSGPETPKGIGYDKPAGLLGNDPKVSPADAPGPKLVGYDQPPRLGYDPKQAAEALLGDAPKPAKEIKPTVKRKPRSTVDAVEVKAKQTAEAAPKVETPQPPKASEPVAATTPVPSRETMVDAAGRTFGVGDSVGFWKKRGNDEQFFEGKVTGFSGDGVAKVETSDGKNLMTKLVDVSEHTPLEVEKAKDAAHKQYVQSIVDERIYKNSLFEAKDAPSLRALAELDNGSLSLASDIMDACEIGYQAKQAKKPRKTKK